MVKVSGRCVKCGSVTEIADLKRWLCVPCAKQERQELAARMRKSRAEYEERLQQEVKAGKATVTYFMGAESA